MSVTVKHPVLESSITFDEVAHSYRDDARNSYESVTTFCGSFFEGFDEVSAAARVAAKENRLEMDVVAEWHKKRDDASAFGTRVHLYAECAVKGMPLPTPLNDQERRAFAIVDKALLFLKRKYEFFDAEQIIFDPLFRIAGTIDLPARNRLTGALAILDWKTCESITNDNYNKRALPPVAHLLDSKQVHYQLQLSTYGWMLTDEQSGYPSAGQPVEIAMIHVPHIGNEPVWRPLEYDGRSVTVMMEHRYRKLTKTQLIAPKGKYKGDFHA